MRFERLITYSTTRPCTHANEGFCCKCQYGNFGTVEVYRDVVDQMRLVPLGYKLVKAQLIRGKHKRRN